MKPLRDLLLVKIIEKSNQTASGLIIKQAWEGPENIVEVVEVGPEVQTMKVGQKLVVNPYAILDTHDKDLKLIKESDVLACLD